MNSTQRYQKKSVFIKFLFIKQLSCIWICMCFFGLANSTYVVHRHCLKPYVLITMLKNVGHRVFNSQSQAGPKQTHLNKKSTVHKTNTLCVLAFHLSYRLIKGLYIWYGSRLLPLPMYNYWEKHSLIVQALSYKYKKEISSVLC